MSHGKVQVFDLIIDLFFFFRISFHLTISTYYTLCYYVSFYIHILIENVDNAFYCTKQEIFLLYCVYQVCDWNLMYIFTFLCSGVHLDSSSIGEEEGNSLYHMGIVKSDLSASLSA